MSAEPVGAQFSENHQARETYSNDRNESLGEDWGVQKTSANGSVVIDVNSDVLQAPWTLTGPNGDRRTGIGSAAVEDLTVGDYTLMWREVSGWITPTPNPDTRALEPGKSIEFEGAYKEVLANVAADLPPVEQPELSTPSALAGGGDAHACSGGDASSPFDTESADNDGARVPVDCECLADLDDEDKAFLALLTALGGRVLHETQRYLRGQEPRDDVYADLANLALRFGDHDTGCTQDTVHGEPDDDDNMDASDLARC